MFTLGTPENHSAAANRVADTIAGGYTQIPHKYYHTNAGRNALGLVGGNEVSMASGNLVDIESDLRGTTRDLSKAPSKQYQPSCPLGSVQTPTRNHLAPLTDACPPWPKRLLFTERATGKLRMVNTEPRHLPTIQMFSYPGVPMPDPLVQETHGSPWRF
jgi:hypothetical protein